MYNIPLLIKHLDVIVSSESLVVLTKLEPGLRSRQGFNDLIVETATAILNKVPDKHVINIDINTYTKSFEIDFVTETGWTNFEVFFDDPKVAEVIRYLDYEPGNTYFETIVYLEKDQDWYDDLFSGKEMS